MPTLVSIIIPCYNAAPWIGEAIQSALDQTYSPVEVIVVDDGSTDRSPEVIKSFGDKIKWETGPNRGGNCARNRGFALSAGKYIQFLDADDYLLPSKIERQMRVFGNASADVVYEDCQVLFESAIGRHKWGPLEVSGNPPDIFEIFLDYNSLTPPCVFLFSRSVVERAGGWNEKLTSAQDTDFYVRLALADATWLYVPGSESIYRRPSLPTVSSRNPRATAENLIEVLGEAESKLRESGRLTDSRRRVLSRSYLRVARNYFYKDVSWSRELFHEAQRLSPSFLDDRSRKYRFAAGALGVSGAERVRALAAAGTRWLRRRARSANDSSRRARVRPLPMLLYHNVGPRPAEDPSLLTVATEQFERQMRWLVSRGYQTIWPSDWRAARRGRKPLPRKPVMLTFDDGYADMVEFAFPVLRRYGLKAAAYVVTKRLGLTNTWDEVNGHRTMRLMTAEQIRECAAQGIEFGSHTRTHPHLTSLSKEQLTDEIEGSRDDLRDLLGTEVVSFAYPYGDGVDSSLIREHLSSTYRLGLTTWDGLNQIETNPYELRRVMILPGDSLADFACKLGSGKSLPTMMREHLSGPIRTVARLGWRALRASWAQ
ncbi:MAG TPA: glycosyltransferase [Candidatus Binataceae bacterium]|nr:glycosyltransferase [Candidatus Binataceae bacterium]